MKRHWARISTWIALCCLFPWTATAGPAPASLELTTAGPVSWQGSAFSNAATPAPEACAAEPVAAVVGQRLCDVVALRVAAGDAYWLAHPRATVQVGIQWKDFSAAESDSEYDDFDLYVYDDGGQLVASSAGGRSSSGIASSAQVVDIAQRNDGDYQIVVVASNVAERSYHGVAMLQTNEPPTQDKLLPELIPLQPTNFKLAIGTYSLSRVTSDARSCYVEETLQDGSDPAHGPTRCLRFDAGHANLGDGPLMFDIDLSQLQPATDDRGRPALGGPVYQIVEHGDGTSDRMEVGTYVFHPNHAHIHFRAFARYDLYRVSGGVRDEEAIPSKKSDFCMIEVDDLWFGLPGNTPRIHHFPQCNTFDESSAGADGSLVQHQGINRGWADIYTWDLPGQYIDISSLPAPSEGDYDIVNVVNPLNVIAEKNLLNNEASTRIHISIAADGTTKVTCIPEPFGCPAGA